MRFRGEVRDPRPEPPALHPRRPSPRDPAGQQLDDADAILRDSHQGRRIQRQRFGELRAERTHPDTAPRFGPGRSEGPGDCRAERHRLAAVQGDGHGQGPLAGEHHRKRCRARHRQGQRGRHLERGLRPDRLHQPVDPHDLCRNHHRRGHTAGVRIEAGDLRPECRAGGQGDDAALQSRNSQDVHLGVQLPQPEDGTHAVDALLSEEALHLHRRVQRQQPAAHPRRGAPPAHGRRPLRARGSHLQCREAPVDGRGEHGFLVRRLLSRELLRRLRIPAQRRQARQAVDPCSR